MVNPTINPQFWRNTIHFWWMWGRFMGLPRSWTLYNISIKMAKPKPLCPWKPHPFISRWVHLLCMVSPKHSPKHSREIRRVSQRGFFFSAGPHSTSRTSKLLPVERHHALLGQNPVLSEIRFWTAASQLGTGHRSLSIQFLPSISIGILLLCWLYKLSKNNVHAPSCKFTVNPCKSLWFIV